MRFRVDTEAFRKAIDAASHATGANTLTPILDNILIEAAYKKILLTGNNLEMAIEYVIEEGVDVEVEGKFTVSSKFLTSYVSLVQDKEITIELEKGGSLLFSTKSWQTKFKGISAEKFPIIPTLSRDTPLRFRAKDLKIAIEKTLFSTADGNVRPVLAGISLRTTSRGLILASTDSFRLSEFVIKTPVESSTPAIIIPKKTANELSKLLSSEREDEMIEVYIHENQILIIAGHTKLSSRLLAGKFPDYEAFFPKEQNTKTTVLRSEFMTGLRQANLIAKENNHNTRIRSLLEGTIEISTGDTEVGASTLSLPASVEGVADIIGINAQYLLETLSVIKEDYVSFEYKSALSPIVIQWVPAETNDYGYRHLIMPLKI